MFKDVKDLYYNRYFDDIEDSDDIFIDITDY